MSLCGQPRWWITSAGPVTCGPRADGGQQVTPHILNLLISMVMRFKSRPEARDWCKAHYPGSPITEIGRDASKRAIAVPRGRPGRTDVNGPRNLLTLGRVIFPTLAGVVISRLGDRASILWGSAAAFGLYRSDRGMD